LAKPTKSYLNTAFLTRVAARPLRLLAEYLEPRERFERHQIADTIVIFGSARARFSDDGTPPATPEDAVMSRYYDEARELARRLTEWSKSLEGESKRRFVICSGGGPGIMEAANRGASDAHGINVGLGISLPFEQSDNPYITRELSFEFHYFFMRKFWFVYLSKAIIIFPGGFGTMDEFFEVLTLVQTKKLKRPLPIVLFGAKYWNEVVNFDALVKYRTINAADLDLFLRTDSVDEAFSYVTKRLVSQAIDKPGGSL
jgi:uncharacterized protein (TIGR00730 family)